MSNGKREKSTLSDDDFTATSAPISRRAAVTAVSTIALGASATQLAGCFVVPARGYQQPVATTTVTYQPTYYTGLTDSDGGSYADQAGYGRGGARGVQTGISDSDSGAYADPAGQGRGHYNHRGWTSGITDGDSGAYADPGGNGRGTARMGRTGMTDSDGGPYADPAGQGRGRYR